MVNRNVVCDKPEKPLPLCLTATLLRCQSIVVFTRFPSSLATRFCRLLRLAQGFSLFFLHFPHVAEVAIIHTAV
jgi:hypothetical protein